MDLSVIIYNHYSLDSILMYTCTRHMVYTWLCPHIAMFLWTYVFGKSLKFVGGKKSFCGLMYKR